MPAEEPPVLELLLGALNTNALIAYLLFYTIHFRMILARAKRLYFKQVTFKKVAKRSAVTRIVLLEGAFQPLSLPLLISDLLLWKLSLNQRNRGAS